MLSPSLDRPENPASAVVVNERFVRKFMPHGMDAVGQRIDDADKEENWTRIVGVTGNIRQDIYEQPLAERDWLINAIPMKDRPMMLGGMQLVMRVDGDPQAIVPALRMAIHEIDPTVPFKNAETMTEVVATTLVFERMESWLFGIFAGLALLLALVGLYGLVSHEVEQGTRDIGVRLALGASRGLILAMVMRRVAWMLGTGAIAGLLLTMATRKVIGVVIYFEAEHEAGGIATVAAALMIAGLLAALIPSFKAASTEPMQALRTE